MDCNIAKTISEERLSFFGISLSSPDMDVYSTVMNCDNMHVNTYYQDIVNFRKSITLKRHSLALITGPLFQDMYADSSDEEAQKESRKEMGEFYDDGYEKCFLYHFKKLFPNVPFIGTFRDDMGKTFGIDLMNGKRFTFVNDAVVITTIYT